MTVVSLDEHRALRDQERSDLDYTPLPIDQALPHARRILANLEGQTHVEPDHQAGQCSSCHTEAAVRFSYGPTLILCRNCRRARLRAAAMADMPLPTNYGPDLAAALIDKARRWIPRVATTMPLAHIQRALEQQGIPTAHIHELIDQAANLARSETPTTIATDDDARKPVVAP